MNGFGSRRLLVRHRLRASPDGLRTRPLVDSPAVVVSARRRWLGDVEDGRSRVAIAYVVGLNGTVLDLSLVIRTVGTNTILGAGDAVIASAATPGGDRQNNSEFTDCLAGACATLHIGGVGSFWGSSGSITELNCS